MSATTDQNHFAADQKYLSVKQAAALLGISPRTVWRMIADGDLTPERFRRCTRIMLSQLLNIPKK